ncbi:MAG TPA: tRNA (adenosine(37)-N6)-threonylcarbamoyltransferase complex ATPase subunit type 1 TsaE [Kofleriaceae bacterium]|nr:tRNA (adenosine(37)-N6)-threonylcarbamoyltransferase complex ATPase subunit type 1 TsaE [Kofleriaceae bacterium]
MIALPDAAATARLGAALAAVVQGGDAIALCGELGAGKTTLVAGLVDALGGGAAHSPTFALVHEYAGGRLVVWHVDLYRIARPAELVELGLDELFGDPRGIVVVEWADRFDVGGLSPDGSGAEGRRGSIDVGGLSPDGSGAEGRRGSITVMPRDHLRLDLHHAGDARRAVATGLGPRGVALARAVLAFR